MGVSSPRALSDVGLIARSFVQDEAHVEKSALQRASQARVFHTMHRFKL
jgi:hypothetical protein